MGAQFAAESFLLGGAGNAFEIAEGTAAGRITVIGSDGATMRNLAKLIPDGDEHLLLVHGEAYWFEANGVRMSAQEVGEVMLGQGFKEGTTVRCVSCNSGLQYDGAAAQLSRFLNSPVIAPTGRVRVLRGGGFELDKFGQWVRFPE